MPSLFEQTLLPHLPAAYNLARWLVREHDAEDAMQEAYLRALRFFGGFRGGDGRAWFLAIVRNACYDLLHRSSAPIAAFDEDAHTPEDAVENPEEALLRHADTAMLRRALERLPVALREALVLRELEGLSYKEIARVTGVAMGTVMSRLARARARLRQELRGGQESGSLR